jgi:hypothetical protein
MCVELLLLSFTSSWHVAYAQRQLPACSLILLWFIVLFLLSAGMRLVLKNEVLVEILPLVFHGLSLLHHKQHSYIYLK